MEFLSPIKATKKARIGLYTIGLKAYWGQFEGLKERLIEYGIFIEKKMSVYGEVYNFGLVLVDSEGAPDEHSSLLVPLFDKLFSVFSRRNVKMLLKLFIEVVEIGVAYFIRNMIDLEGCIFK